MRPRERALRIVICPNETGDGMRIGRRDRAITSRAGFFQESVVDAGRELLDPHDATFTLDVASGYADDLRDATLLVVTLSDRSTDREGIAVSRLGQRYSRADRLVDLPDWRSFPSAAEAQRFGGSILVCRLDVRAPSVEPAFVLRPHDDKPQHAILAWPDLWVLGVRTLRRYRMHLGADGPNLQLAAECDDPWLSGGHTLDLSADGMLLVSASAGDAVLAVDGRSLEVVWRWRLPSDAFGSNWPIGPTDDLREHYIPNDFQLAHLNGAAWHGRGFVYSTLSGTIGYASVDGLHQILLSGLTSSHGIRSDAHEGLYFSDSAAGMIIGLDEEDGIQWRQSVDSRWLHDSLHVGDGFYVCLLTDACALWLIHRDSLDPILTADLAPFGAGPQFASLTHRRR